MLKFLLKRLVWVLPVLFLIILLLFILDQFTLTDQFHRSIIQDEHTGQFSEGDREMMREEAESRGWNLPPFYFSLKYKGWSREVYGEIDPLRRRIIRSFMQYTLDFNTAKELSDVLFDRINTSHSEDGLCDNLITDAWRSGRVTDLWNYALFWNAEQPEDNACQKLSELIRNAEENRTLLSGVPILFWNGTRNRLHQFLSQYLTGGRLRSSIDGRTVYAHIWPSAGITLLINVISLVLVLLLGVPVGRLLYRLKNPRLHHLLSGILYFFYAIPLFWIATAVLMIGGGLSGQMATGIPHLQDGETPGILTFLRPENWIFLVLPVVSIVLSLVAVVAIHMYRAMAETGTSKFITAARARGLGEAYVASNHNKPVAIFSIVTLVGNSIPQLISGSVVIEIIYNIPGMGRLLWRALYAFDWNLVTGVLLVGVLFSIIGQLLTDLAYYKINPELRSEQ